MSTRTKQQTKKRQVSLSDGVINVNSNVSNSTDSIAQQLAKLQAEEAANEREFKWHETEMQREFELEKIKLEAECKKIKLEATSRTQQIDNTQQTASSESNFRADVASKQLPAFTENAVEEYMSMFEKVRKSNKWPKTQWSAILQPNLIRCTLKAFSDMTTDDLSNFDKLKE